MAFSDYNLKYNPFQYNTPKQGTELVWAGMREEKNIITNIYTQSYKQDSKKIILNWGPWGGGKTHAALYFSKNRINANDSDFLHLYVQLPKSDKDVVEELVRSIILEIGTQQCHEYIQNAISIIGHDNFKSEITVRTNEIIASTIYRLFTGQFSAELVQKYITRGLTTAQLDKTHIIDNLKTPQNYIDFLAGLLIAINLGGERRIFLWIDELEEVITFSGKQFKHFNLSLRDLLDKVNERIITFLNFTFSENELESLRTMFTPALWSRMTDYVKFDGLSHEGAKLYCKELIQAALLDTNELPPFSNDLIVRVLQTLPDSMRTPRDINKRFHIILNYADQNGYKAITIDIINTAITTL